jgi:hypothetical protein
MSLRDGETHGYLRMSLRDGETRGYLRMSLRDWELVEGFYVAKEPPHAFTLNDATFAVVARPRDGSRGFQPTDPAIQNTAPRSDA